MTARPRAAATKRILISGGLAVGGPQTHVTLLARVLREAGAEVTIAAASTNWPEGALADLRRLGVRVVCSKFGFGRWKFLGKLWAFVAWPFLLRRDYEVVYCVGEGRMHLWAGRFAAPGAWKIYHEIVDCPRRGSVPAEVAAKMDGVIANSRDVAVRMADLLGMERVRSIPFFTAPGPVHFAPRSARGGKEELRLAFLGRLAPHKRPDKLIEAFARWKASGDLGPMRLDFYGGDYDVQAGQLRSLISKLDLESSVRLRGAYAAGDLGRIFAETDLVVLPSEYEGLPLVLVEAMQRGVPVVATSAGGTAELGEANPDVIISEGKDWKAFEAAVAEMVSRMRAGRIDSARLHAWTEERYGFQRVAGMWRLALLTPEIFFAREKGASTIQGAAHHG